MKKFAALSALLLLLGCFSGCMPEEPDHNTASTPPPTSTGAAIQQTTLPAFTTGPDVNPTMPSEVELSQIPLSSAATPVIQEAFYAEDGTLLLNYIYQNIFLIHQDAAVADSVYLALVNELDYSDGLQEALQQAKADYAAKPAGWTSYRYQVLFNTMRIDQTVLSILGEVTSITSETASQAVASSYSLINGKRLTFQDIKAKGYHYYDLLLLIDAQLKNSPAANSLFDGYQQTITKQLQSKDASNWYFSENGLCFYYQPYEISPNSAGTVTIEIPYSELSGILHDDYFPAEEYITGGSAYAQLFSQADPFRYQTFAEIIQDELGEEFLISTDGAISDLRLVLGSWNLSGTEFIPTATVFACDGLCAETAILVQCQLPDVMPILRITYTSAGVAHTQYITQSGKDGTIILVNS